MPRFEDRQALHSIGHLRLPQDMCQLLCLELALASQVMGLA